VKAVLRVLSTRRVSSPRVVISIHRTFRLAAGRLAEDLRNKKRRHLNGFTGLLSTVQRRINARLVPSLS
jgi:hypothetical protein